MQLLQHTEGDPLTAAGAHALVEQNVVPATTRAIIDSVNPILASVLTPQTPGLAPISWTNPQISGRFKSKFESGWLGGTGSSSQFQSATSCLPVLPPNSNFDLDARIAQSRGLTVSGVPLLPSWRREYAFHPGTGTDAARSGITRTPAQAGISTWTGVAAPLVTPGLDATGAGPIPVAFTNVGMGLNAMMQGVYVGRDPCLPNQLQRRG